jgi:hypothetical protein
VVGLATGIDLLQTAVEVHDFVIGRASPCRPRLDPQSSLQISLRYMCYSILKDMLHMVRAERETETTLVRDTPIGSPEVMYANFFFATTNAFVISLKISLCPFW